MSHQTQEQENQSEQKQQPQQSQPLTQQQQQQQPGKFKFLEFCNNEFIPPKPFNFGELIAAETENQVAGHSNFLSTEPSHCLKPINPKCARGRREHLFYQLVRFFEDVEASEGHTLYYKDFPLLNHPDKDCECVISPETFRTILPFVADFVHVKHLTLEGDDFATNEEKQRLYHKRIYSDALYCPCYGSDRVAKHECSTDYDQEDYLCLEDFSAHCREPCILDIKMGRITYDPVATAQKIEEQLCKYPRLRDFGFRILGMKTKDVTKDKDFGRSLEAQEQVFEAIESFFEPLETNERKVVVVGKILDRLERLLEWFEVKNSSQLRFFSSSLLFVYDSDLDKDVTETVAMKRLTESVRVAMIDFAHVFHSHDIPDGPSRSGSGTSIVTSGSLNKDDNYLYGLRRLVKFFIMLNRQYRMRISQANSQKSGT